MSRTRPARCLTALVFATGMACAEWTSAQQFGVGEHPKVDFGSAVTINFGGRLEVDNATRVDREGESGLELGRQRVGVSGSLFDRVSFEIDRAVDGDAPWRDVWVAVQPVKSLELRAGKFKAPFSRAQTTSSTRLPFIRRPLAAEALAPGRQVGAGVEGHFWKKTVVYEGGAFRERTLPDVTGARGPGSEMFAGRVTVRPFRKRGWLDSLEIAAAATTGDRPEALDGVSGFPVADRTPFFPEVWVRGRRLRTGYELAWSGGPLSMQGEYLVAADERRGQGLRGEDLPELTARGWYVSGTWRLFGERRDRDLPIGPAPLSGAGALDVSGRIEGLRFSSASSEPAFRNPRAAHVLANSDRVVTVGVAWRFSRFGRVQCDVAGERIEDAARSPIGSSARFWTVLTRLQLHL
jgi:phosphate-selective porin OprO/OprP